MLLNLKNSGKSIALKTRTRTTDESEELHENRCASRETDLQTESVESVARSRVLYFLLLVLHLPLLDLHLLDIQEKLSMKINSFIVCLEMIEFPKEKSQPLMFLWQSDLTELFSKEIEVQREPALREDAVDRSAARLTPSTHVLESPLFLSAERTTKKPVELSMRGNEMWERREKREGRREQGREGKRSEKEEYR